MAGYTTKEQELIQGYAGTITKCPTAYNRENKQATHKSGYGDMMTTAYEMVVCSNGDDVAPSEYDMWVESKSYGYEHAMVLAEMELYTKLMKLDPKYMRVLSKVKKHIKRKARAKANKNNVSCKGTIKRKAYKKRDKVVLPSQVRGGV